MGLNYGDRYCDSVFFDRTDALMSIELSGDAPKVTLRQNVMAKYNIVKHPELYARRSTAVPPDPQYIEGLEQGDAAVNFLMEYHFDTSTIGTWSCSENGNAIEFRYVFDPDWHAQISSPSWDALSQSEMFDAWRKIAFGVEFDKNVPEDMPRPVVSLSADLNPSTELHIDHTTASSLFLQDGETFQPDTLSGRVFFPHDFIIFGNIRNK